MKRFKGFMFATALLLTCTSQAFALGLTVGGSPELFRFEGGTGWIDSPAEGYSLTTNSSIRIDLTDRLMIGDRYQLYVNNILRLTTSAINYSLDGDQTGATTFSQAWNNQYLSKGSLFLGPGSYDLDIRVIRVADGVNYGSGYIRAVGVPEPASLLLLGFGILFFGLLYNRKSNLINS